MCDLSAKQGVHVGTIRVVTAFGSTISAILVGNHGFGSTLTYIRAWFCAIATFVDRFSKLVIFVPCHTTINA